MSAPSLTPEFKEETIKQVRDRVCGVLAVAARLGVPAQSLYKWVLCCVVVCASTLTARDTAGNAAELIGSAATTSRTPLETYPLPTAMKQYQIVGTTWPLPFPEANSLSISSTPGEFVPASFVLRALEKFDDMSIKATELVGSGQNTIPPKSVDIRLVKTWYQASDGKCSCHVGKYLIPELLLRDDALVMTDRDAQKSYLRATLGDTQQYVDITTVGSAVPSGAVVMDTATLQPFSMQSNTNKQVWVTINVPPDTPAGTYIGKLMISTPAQPDTVLSLSVNVLPFTLSPPLTEQAIYYRALLNETCPSITPECRTPEQMAADLENMRDHGIQYPTIYDRVTSPLLAKRFALMKSAGLPRDKLYQLGDNLNVHGASNQSNVAKFTTEWKKISSDFGWGQVYNYGIDEATGSIFDTQLASFDTIHANGGKIFNAIPDAATALRTGVEKIDSIILYGGRIQAANISQIRRLNSNGKIFMYGNPYSDFENAEFVRRRYGFWLLYADFDGAMEYVYQAIGQNVGSIWNDFKPDATGDRNLAWTYPTTNGVLDTLQWEGYRMAVDDIRYASTLAARKGWTKGQLVSYLRGLSTLAENPELIDATATRQTIIDQILATLPTDAASSAASPIDSR